MIYKQVRSEDANPRTNLQVTINKPGKKPEFAPYKAPRDQGQMKKGDRISLMNGTVLALEDQPIIGGGMQEFYRVLGIVQIPAGSPTDQSAWVIQEPRPADWPDPCYVKAMDLTSEFFFEPGQV
jgi:hypothetical protein